MAHASHRKSFLGLFFGLGSVRARRALTEHNPKNRPKKTFSVTCVRHLEQTFPPKYGYFNLNYHITDKKVHPNSSHQEEPDFFKSSLQEAEASDLKGDGSTTSNVISSATTITKATNFSNLSPLYPYSKVSSTAKRFRFRFRFYLSWFPCYKCENMI